MATDPEAPRLRPVEPPDVRDSEVDAADLLPGDLVEGVRYAELDIAGRRLTELEVDECVLEVFRADDADLRGLRIRDTVIGSFDAPVLRAARTTWQRVRIQSGRVGSAELYDSGFDGVVFEGLKLGFVNLRASKLTDVLFRDCTIDELDLDGAQLQRVAFEGCAVREVTGSAAVIRGLDLRGATLDRVDRIVGLRGATISADQVYELAPMLAQQAGLQVR